jgi:hypothetical protein
LVILEEVVWTVAIRVDRKRVYGIEVFGIVPFVFLCHSKQ